MARCLVYPHILKKSTYHKHFVRYRIAKDAPPLGSHLYAELDKVFGQRSGSSSTTTCASLCLSSGVTSISLPILSGKDLDIYLSNVNPRHSPQALHGNARGASATYNVPDSNVRVTLKAFTPRIMDPSDLAELLVSATAHLDALATQAGGPKAWLRSPHYQWISEGLIINNYDMTVHNPQPSGGPYRFDELKAVYTGVGAVAHKIGFRECTISVDRVSGILKRKVKYLGNGYVMFNSPREVAELGGQLANETGAE